jgi:hypothetical protein
MRIQGGHVPFHMRNTSRINSNTRRRIARYFVHGILWSIAFTFVVLVWISIFVGLLFMGYIAWWFFILALVVGFPLLFLLIGLVNSAITNIVWGREVNLGLISNLIHGFVLFIALLIAQIPGSLINGFLPNPVTVVAVFILYCFIDGFVAKSLAAGLVEK